MYNDRKVPNAALKLDFCSFIIVLSVHGICQTEKYLKMIR